MSAAAAARSTSSRSRRTEPLAPHEARWNDLLQRQGYVRTPHAFRHILASCSMIEITIVWHVLSNTVGNKTRGEKPEWIRITHESFARMAGCGTRGVEKAVAKISAEVQQDDSGAWVPVKPAESTALLEYRKVGRNNEYRVVMDNWPRACSRSPRQLDRKPMAAAQAAAEAAVEDSPAQAALRVMPAPQVLVILPGEQKPKPITEACPHGPDCALAAQYSDRRKRVLQTQSHPTCSVESPASDNSSLNGKTPELEFGDSTSNLRAKMNRLLHPLLHTPIDDRLLAYIAASGVPFETIEAAVRRRARMFNSASNSRASWGGVLVLVRELADAQKQAATAEQQLSAAERRRAAAQHRKALHDWDQAKRQWIDEIRAELADPATPDADRRIARARLADLGVEDAEP